MHRFDTTQEALLALLASDGEETTEAILARSGLTPEKIAQVTGRSVAAEPKPLPYWASRLPGPR